MRNNFRLPVIPWESGIFPYLRPVNTRCIIVTVQDDVFFILVRVDCIDLAKCWGIQIMPACIIWRELPRSVPCCLLLEQCPTCRDAHDQGDYYQGLKKGFFRVFYQIICDCGWTKEGSGYPPWDSNKSSDAGNNGAKQSLVNALMSHMPITLLIIMAQP